MVRSQAGPGPPACPPRPPRRRRAASSSPCPKFRDRDRVADGEQALGDGGSHAPVPQSPMFMLRPQNVRCMDGGFDPLRRERHVAHPDPERMRDGVADRGGRRPRRAFAGAERGRACRLDDPDRDARAFVEARGSGSRPRTVRHALGGPADLLLQGPARRLDHAALDLVHEAVRWTTAPQSTAATNRASAGPSRPLRPAPRSRNSRPWFL